MKLRGTALLFTLVISMIICLIVGFVILIKELNTKYVLRAETEERVQYNCLSALHAAMNDSNFVQPNSSQLIDLYGQGRDSVRMIRRDWGMFEIFVSNAFSHGIRARKVALTALVGDTERIALYLTENGKPLSLCGQTELNGIVFAPQAGLRPAFIEGKSFVGTELVKGETRVSAASLPEFPMRYLKKIIRSSAPADFQTDFPDHLSASFSDSTVYFSPQRKDILITRSLAGNIIIQCTDMVRIAAEAQLEDIILVAKKVIVQSGFSGNLQIFATDSIVVEDKVQLQYPSVLALLKSDREEADPTNKEIKIKGKSEVSGLVLVDDRGMISLSAESLVKGLVYSKGSVECRGRVEGSIFTNSFMLRTASGIYENHLLDTRISPKALPAYFCYPVPQMNAGNSKKKLLKWLL